MSHEAQSSRASDSQGVTSIMLMSESRALMIVRARSDARFKTGCCRFGERRPTMRMIHSVDPVGTVKCPTQT